MSVKSPRVTIVLLVRNAEKSIIDWLSWHLALGVHRVIIADAGSTDGTKPIIQDLALKWPLELLAPSLKPEMTAGERRLFLTRKALERLSDKTGWILFLDVDEYLYPDDSLTSLIDRARNTTDAIALHWCLFGTGGNHKRPKGHLVATHGWRADISVPEHKFVRLLTRLSALKDPEKITDPITLDIPPKRWSAATGKPWSSDNETDTLWEGGRILHYVCSDYEKPVSTPLSGFVRKYFNRNNIRDLAGNRYLGRARLFRNRLFQTLFAAGLLRLRKMVDDRQWVEKPVAETDLSLPDEAERFGFSYRRVRLSEEEKRLVSPQAFPPMDTTRVFLLRTSSGAMLEADGTKDEHKAVLCLIQDRYPQLIMLFCAERQEFTLNDIVSFDHYAISFTRPTHREGLLTLPAESGRGGLYYEMITSLDPQISSILPLPPYDEPQGLSLKGLMEWLYSQPDAQPYDIRRGLMLLSDEAARTLGEQIPSLQPFIGDSLARN
ncbi:glycosyltransferase family 2 protein [Acetobacteraceae bacterium ESL0709]|nr:glycosyltransferase family 2 protein [Acetobacteraceae bacterium ESL0697]MDF7677434.1 glycosyltransferase family 2 protein [Acetobacteraceae bacterium ESL0709]